MNSPQAEGLKPFQAPAKLEVLRFYIKLSPSTAKLALAPLIYTRSEEFICGFGFNRVKIWTLPQL
jgi:hypothetical protein